MRIDKHGRLVPEHWAIRLLNEGAWAFFFVFIGFALGALVCGNVNEERNAKESAQRSLTECDVVVSMMKLSAESLEWEEVRQRGQWLTQQ